MIATELPELPRDLIESVFHSDRTTGGRATLPAGGRDRALAWLRRALVDFASLEQHLALLQEYYDAPFRFPRPRRDCWTAEQLLPHAGPTKFQHTDRLPDERVAAVADQGIEAFSDQELAGVLLNPFALYDLFDVIDDLQPEHWLADFHRLGKELLAVNATSRPSSGVAVGAVSATRSARRFLPRLKTVAALAACLLVGLLVGVTWMRGGRSKPFEVLVAQAEMKSTLPRGGSGKVPAVVIHSDRKGFASVVALFPRDAPFVFPSVASGSIPVQPGEAAASPPLPPGLEEAKALFIVVTEQPASEVIHRALEGTKFAPDQIDQVQALLAEKLAMSNYHWAAFSKVALPTAGEP